VIGVAAPPPQRPPVLDVVLDFANPVVGGPGSWAVSRVTRVGRPRPISDHRPYIRECPSPGPEELRYRRWWRMRDAGRPRRSTAQPSTSPAARRKARHRSRPEWCRCLDAAEVFHRRQAGVNVGDPIWPAYRDSARPGPHRARGSGSSPLAGVVAVFMPRTWAGRSEWLRGVRGRPMLDLDPWTE
jgi:hypothetical protein